MTVLRFSKKGMFLERILCGAGIWLKKILVLLKAVVEGFLQSRLIPGIHLLDSPCRGSSPLLVFCGCGPFGGSAGRRALVSHPVSDRLSGRPSRIGTGYFPFPAGLLEDRLGKASAMDGAGAGSEIGSKFHQRRFNFR